MQELLGEGEWSTSLSWKRSLEFRARMVAPQYQQWLWPPLFLLHRTLHWPLAPTLTVAKYLLSTYPYGCETHTHKTPEPSRNFSERVIPILLYLYLSSVVLTTLCYMSSFYISQIWALDSGHRARLLFWFPGPNLVLSIQQACGPCGTDG